MIRNPLSFAIGMAMLAVGSSMLVRGQLESIIGGVFVVGGMLSTMFAIETKK